MMQTFLPYEDFAKSAQVLDMRRLGKQRVEGMQIMRALTDPTYGWQNHPAVKMWRGHESWLMGYLSKICREWVARGYKDTCYDKTLAIYLEAFPGYPTHPRPPWLGNRRFHLSHRRNLLRKDWLWYRKFWPRLSDALEYVWPVS